MTDTGIVQRETRAWNAGPGHFVDGRDSERLDAGLLLLADIGFVKAREPRFMATVDAIGAAPGGRNDLLRHLAPDDPGTPGTSFNMCAFWYIKAIFVTARKRRAPGILAHTLKWRDALDMLSQDPVSETAGHRGNDPRPYFLVRLMHRAMCPSMRREDTL